MCVAFIKSKFDQNVSRKKSSPKNEALDRQDIKLCVTLCRDFKSGKRDFKSGQRLQIEAGITNRCRTTRTDGIVGIFFLFKNLLTINQCVLGAKLGSSNLALILTILIVFARRLKLVHLFARENKFFIAIRKIFIKYFGQFFPLVMRRNDNRVHPFRSFIIIFLVVKGMKL